MDDLFKRVGTTQTLSSKIERNIEKAIREKKLKDGDKLPSERELCEMFAVSRTALREALRRLSARGLIEIKKGSGMYVKRIKMEDAIKSLNLYYDLKFDDNLISNIISVRKHFEPVIAYMAALQRSEKSLELMEKNIADFEACDPDNTQLESDLDNKFHSLIAYATENPIVIVTTEPIHSLLPRMRNYVYANIEGVKDITLGYHKGIYKAIKEQDAERAQELMQAHANRDADVFNKFLKKSLPND